MIRRGIGVQSFVAAGGADDAQAVIAAIESTGVTLTTTQKNACTTLISDLKTYGIWTKMKAVYGFLGGTAGAHKWNWKNPADTDAAFRLVFSGGWTHSSTGAKPNGINGNANTFLFPSTSLQLNSASHGVYSGTNTASNGSALGAVSQVGNYRLTTMYLSYLAANFEACINDETGTTISNTNTSGFFILSRTANNATFASIRNTITTRSPTVTERSAQNILLGTTTNTNNNTGNIGSHSPWEHRFTFIGDGLTTTEAANLYTAVQAYQTTLSRNV